MSVISITINESQEQIVAGFPRTVALSANMPCTIFYTLNGATPDTSSLVYVEPIEIPTDQNEVILSIFATNGTDSSPIITKSYTTNILNNTRFSHSWISGIVETKSGFPYSSGINFSSITYLAPSETKQVVDNPSLPVIPYGYDAQGNPTGGTNLPLTEYLLIPTETDDVNSPLPGTIPGNVKVVGRVYPQEYAPKESKRSDKIFNPKAMVIFQDAATEDKALPPMINRSDFSTENYEVMSNGAKYAATSLETPTTTGSFIKAHYNPRTQTMTNYYRDSSTNKWIISSYPYQPKELQPNIPFVVSQAGPRIVGKIFKWHLWQRRVLT